MPSTSAQPLLLWLNWQHPFVPHVAQVSLPVSAGRPTWSGSIWADCDRVALPSIAC
jgi:hypothetical protein